MLNKENKELCWQVLSKYGIRNQMFKVIEECAELQEAVSHAFQSDFDISTVSNLNEELVDVIVVCQQMLFAQQISMDEVNARAKKKLERALKNEQRC